MRRSDSLRPPGPLRQSLCEAFLSGRALRKSSLQRLGVPCYNDSLPLAMGFVLVLYFLPPPSAGPPVRPPIHATGGRRRACVHAHDRVTAANGGGEFGAPSDWEGEKGRRHLQIYSLNKQQ